MSGRPGTPHFGDYPDIHTKAEVKTPVDGPVKKFHFMFDPAQVSRPMGSTEGGKPGCGWEPAPRERDYMCNHDGFVGGDMHNLNMDEQKVLQNTIYTVEFEYADDFQHNWGSEERTA